MMIKESTKMILVGVAIGTVGLAALKGVWATFVHPVAGRVADNSQGGK